MRYFLVLCLLVGIGNTGFTQTVSTYVGTQNVDYLNGTDTNATFRLLYDIAIDVHGNLFLADLYNNAIRKITPAHVVSTFADSTTIPTLIGPAVITVDSQENIYYSQQGDSKIWKITPGGVATVFAGTNIHGQKDTLAGFATFNNIRGLLAAENGTVYVADNYKIRKVATGVVTTLAGGNSFGDIDGAGAGAAFNMTGHLCLDSNNNIYLLDRLNNKIRKISPAGAVTTYATSAQYLNGAEGIRFDRNGNCFVVTSTGNRLLQVSPTGVLTTIAGGYFCNYVNGAGTAARFCDPVALVIDSLNNKFICDAGNSVIRMVTPTGLVTTFAGNHEKHCVNGIDATHSILYRPTNAAFDSSGNLYVAESANRIIRKITPSGAISIFCGNGSYGNQNGSAFNSSFKTPAGIVVNKKTGRVYVIDVEDYSIRVIAPDGTSAFLAGNGTSGDVDGLGVAASFFPVGYAAMDTVGNIYFTSNSNKIKKITPAGMVTSYTGSFTTSPNNVLALASFPNIAGIAIDPSGDIFVSQIQDAYIFKISRDSIITMIPGYPQGYSTPLGMAIDAAGNIYVADYFDDVIRKIAPDGTITQLAGNVMQSGFVDGPINVAQFWDPVGVVVDKANNIYVSDRDNNAIRKITIHPTSVLGQRGLSPEATVSILPNPNTGEFCIATAGNWKAGETKKLIISNSIGQIVYAGYLEANKKLTGIALKNAHLPAGQYIVTVRSKEKIASVKMVVVTDQ